MGKRRTELPRRVVLFPLPFQGHLNPMLQLADLLHSKGFSISIIHTCFNAPASADHPHFSFRPLPEGLPEGEAPAADVVSLISKLNASCEAPFRRLLSQMLSEEEEPPAAVACLITDAWWHFTQAVADGLGLPRIALRTGSVSSFLSFTSLSRLRDKGYLSAAPACQLEARVPELPPLKVKDIPVLCTLEPEITYQGVRTLTEKIRASRGLIFNSFEELETSSLATVREDVGIPVYAIGPFHKQGSGRPSSSLLEQDGSCLPWLDAQAPSSVLYVSFGSLISVDRAEFEEIAWGLAESGQPFLWVVRPGVVRGSDGPGPLPSGFAERVAGRGKVVGWAPQQEVLAHPSVGGFWTHCGWNSTLEAICEGKPMICSPYYGDQRANARYVAEVWRVGLLLEDKLEREDVAKAIKGLMAEAGGREMRENAARLKEEARLCIDGGGGSSYKSLEGLVAHILSF